jgi:hypothetical protein
MAALEFFDGVNWVVIGGNSTGGINLAGDVIGNGLTNQVTQTTFNVTRDFDVTNHKIVNVANPTLFNDATNKSYVDNKTWSASQITDFDTYVQTNKLNEISPPNNSLNLNSQKIINLKAPESANDAVNYKFMFDLLQDETVVVWQQAV